MDILATFTSWCDQEGVITVFKVIKTVINVIRIAVPIGIIIWTVIELLKNVINPDDKDSKKKIFNRIIAAIIVFLIPTIINLALNLVDVGLGGNSGSKYRYNLSECWRKAK